MNRPGRRIKAVIFDWAGTAIDFGSRAPVVAFVRTFDQFGIQLTEAEARAPMGLPKRAHIQALGDIPRIAAEWQRVHGHAFTDSDTDALYAIFEPISAAVVLEHTDLIPGLQGLLATLRRHSIGVGSTTGYSREIMNDLIPRVAARGFDPDCVVCPDDVRVGRPSPLMMYRCFLELGVWPADTCVKVDDTAPGIAEGLAAGCWTVGVAISGNGLGLSARELAGLSSDQLALLTAQAATQLVEAGAHVVIDSVAHLWPVLETIDRCLASGERPHRLAGDAGALAGNTRKAG